MPKPAAPKPDPRELRRRAYGTTYEIRRAATWTDQYMLLADGSVIAGPGDYASILDSFETLTA